MIQVYPQPNCSLHRAVHPLQRLPRHRLVAVAAHARRARWMAALRRQPMEGAAKSAERQARRALAPTPSRRLSLAMVQARPTPRALRVHLQLGV
eukprot:6211443-Pleurochrysis_carterae.AAC.1